MGFFLQLRILLWKNLTLKRRSPFVLAFEVFIPLVLFFILIGIRLKLPARPKAESQYSTMALPSSGIVAVMQTFCDGGHWDSEGFVDHPNARLPEFLTHFQNLAKEHNFFDPGFQPGDMDRIPLVYKEITSDPMLLKHNFFIASNFTLQSVLTDGDEFVDFLQYNLSMPRDEALALTRADVNVKEIYRLLFGTSLDDDLNNSQLRFENYDDVTDNHDVTRRKRDVTTRRRKRGDLSDLSKMAETLVGQNGGGLISRMFEDGGKVPGLTEEGVTDVLRDMLGLGLGTSDAVDPYTTLELLKKILLTPDDLHRLACDKEQLSRMLVAQNQSDQASLDRAENYLCHLNHSQYQELSFELDNYLNSTEIVHKLNITRSNATQTTERYTELANDMETFISFEKAIFELSALAKNLPRGACAKDTSPTGNKMAPTSSYGENFTDTTPRDSPNIAGKSVFKYTGLLKIISAMQMTICGRDINYDNIDLDNFNIDSLHLSHKQKSDLGILVYLLSSNPKVLYSPSGTAVDGIIKKANETFAVLEKISDYARKWLDISEDLKHYLQRNSTEHNLRTLRKMQTDLKTHNLTADNPFLERLLNSTRVGQQDLRILKDFTTTPIPRANEFLRQIDVVDNAACSWLALMKGINLDIYKGFRTEDELVDYALNKAYFNNVSVVAGLVFTNVNSDGTLPNHVIYKIRQNATSTVTTKLVRPQYWQAGPDGDSYSYYKYGFVWLQDIIERAIVDVFVGHDVIEPGTYLHRFPYPCYMDDQFMFMIQHVMPLCLAISWVYSVAMLVQSIVYEKEQRLKEVMKMMGLSNAVHWCAWFIMSFAQMSLTMGILTLMLKYGRVLTYSDPLIIFMMLEAFALSTIMFSFLVSVCYNSAKVAAACAGIGYCLMYVPCMYIAIREVAAGDRISAWFKSFASLLPTTAFGLGSKYFAYFEQADVGVQWSNIAASPVEGDEYSLFSVVLMMIIDSLFYGLLVWYIEAVHPGQYGLPKPWYFPFTKAYWYGHAIKTESEQCSLWNCFRTRPGLSLMEEDQACALQECQGGVHSNFEPEPHNLPLGVCIENLTKVYKSGKVAVNRLSLNLYEGQITSFLGHNGAGKTTTMSILTGLFPPTDGHATICGLDIRTDMEEIRKSLGFCPQHNVLFDKLTVAEHLWFYARLKGMASKQIATEMETMLKEVGLPHKRHAMSDCLSGGMQRKLSVVIAFVAGSKTVILDEPTAGVDPRARRDIWDLLIKYKKGRTILLSTHHMDEADLLGDRIAIISNGQLKCCGSSLFLKSTFGDGYHLFLAKKQAEDDFLSIDTLSIDESSTPSQPRVQFVSKCNSDRVTKFINGYISTAYLQGETHRELHYVLPYEELRKKGFEKLFRAMEAGEAEPLHVGSYGMIDTTLEEVFLEVTEKAKQDEEANLQSDGVSQVSKEPSIKSEITSLKSEVTSLKSDVTSLKAEVTSLSPSHVIAPIPEAEADETWGGPDVVQLTERRMNPPPTAPSHLGHRRQRSWMSSDEEDFFLDPKQLVAPPRVVAAELPDVTQSPRTTVPNKMAGSSRQNGEYSLLVNEEDDDEEDEDDRERPAQDGAGSYTVTGTTLIMRQFYAVLVKRYFYIRRNWKGLFSQILLPALFVCVAMTVALSAPMLNDMPPRELSPAMYYNYTQPKGNFIPYSNRGHGDESRDARPERLIDDLLNSGTAATCLLKTPRSNLQHFMRHLETLDVEGRLEFIRHNFGAECLDVHVKAAQLPSYVPPARSVENNTSSIMDLVPGNPVARFYPLCQCATDGRGFICPSGGYRDAPSQKVLTSDILLDVSSQDEEAYLLNTQDQFKLNRYGGLTLGLTRDYVPREFGEGLPALMRRLAVRNVAKVRYGDKGLHAMPVYLNTLNNAILRANLPPEKGNPAAYGITVLNHPMSKTYNQLAMMYILEVSNVLISIFIIVAMAFVPASFVLFLVYERSLKAKHLQFISGISPVVYWTANYIWDMCNYVIPALCCVTILKIFDIPAYVSSTNLPATVSLFLLYGWSITPMMYPASFWFKESSTAYICLIVVNLFVGITCIISSFLLEMFSYNDDLKKVHSVLKIIFLMFPNYCLGRGLMDVTLNDYRNEYFFKTGQLDRMRSPFDWQIMSRNLVAMAIMGLLFFVITLLCEVNFFFKPRSCSSIKSRHSSGDEDEDVAKERRRVTKGSGKRDLLRILNLTKVYKTEKLGKNLAVDRMCLGVPEGECFGLLGVNGAGKTTTFRMLTGDIHATEGEVMLGKNSIRQDKLLVQKNIGYCPQFDALYDELTAREHCQLYARLRGIPLQDEYRVVDWALNKLGLLPYADKPSKTYSGGNKRKLSTAIALIGHPPLILMDEPTTGMDPHSRRFLWDLIIDLVRSGRSVVLTSHSMEECEALCTRLAIMVAGKFRCLGSLQEMKSKYGEGYTLIIKVKGPNHDREIVAVRRFVERVFGDAVLKKHHYNMLQYELQSSSLELSRVFYEMEHAMREMAIEDYSLCQNTLDNVFNNFVDQQEETTGENETEESTTLLGRLMSGRRRRHRSTSSCDIEDSDDELITGLGQSGTRLEFI